MLQVLKIIKKIFMPQNMTTLFEWYDVTCIFY